MIIRPLTDLDLIKRTITAPTVWAGASDDLSGDPATFQPKAEAIYLGVYDQDEDGGMLYLGLFMGVQITGNTLDLHTCLLPSAWGRADHAGLTAKAWIFANTPYTKIVGSIPSDNRASIRFAKSVGMTQYGVLNGSWLKGGKALDLILVEVNKEASCQQQQ